MPATSTLFPTTVASTTGTTWTTTTNATGSGTGTTSAAWAVFTNATNGGSGGTGTINLSGYAAQSAGPASGDTIDSVVLSLRGNVAATARWTAASCTAQLFDGTTAIGSPVAIGTLSTSTSNVWTVTFTGANAPSYAQLSDLRVRVTAVHTSTTSSTFNVDTAGLVVNYSAPVVPSIVTDTFTRTSALVPGTADTGQTWTAQIGTWGTDGTRLYPVTAGDGDQATIECGNTAQNIQATLAGQGGVSWGLLGRWESTGKFYIAELDGSGFLSMKRVIGGGYNPIATTSGIPVTVGDVYRLEIGEEGGTGTRLNLLRNGTQVLTFLDTDASRPLTGTKAGVRQGFSGGSAKWDDFSINAVVGVTGAGALTAEPAVLSGAGAATVTGTGGLTAATATLTGAGTLRLTGSGAAAATAATLSGAGALRVTGAGTPTATPATLSGTGSLALTGAGSLTATTATLSGSGTITGGTVTGAGALTATPATLAGAGALTATGTGGLTAPPATLSGTGTLRVVGTGSLAATPATLAGTGTERLTGTGALSPSPATLSGSGTVTSPGVVGGTGALTAPAAGMSGAGTLKVVGAGQLAAQAATLAASALLSLAGAGTLGAPPSGLSGDGAVTAPVAGSGVLVAVQASLTGTGTVVDPTAPTVPPVITVGAGRSPTISATGSSPLALSRPGADRELAAVGRSRTLTLDPWE